MDLIAHLSRRAGFGPSRQDLIDGRKAGFEATRDAMLAAVSQPDTTEDLIEPYTRDYNYSDIDDVRKWWYLRMVYSPAPLRELNPSRPNDQPPEGRMDFVTIGQNR
jgi:hypothetical protein